MKSSCPRKLASFLLLAAVATSTIGGILLFVGGCTSKKTDDALHLVLLENPKSLDPILSSDALAAEIIGNVYEPLYQYHYLKRPYELIPLLADGMPVTSKDGLTVTVKIKPGLLFQDDPCFKDGKGREVTAQDFIYGFKRLADPKNQAEGWWIFDGRIMGFNEWRDQAVKNGAADYNAAVEGLQTPDDHTLVFKLKKKYPQLIYVLAMAYSAPMPHEAIEKYGAEIVSHSVGTGPYVISDYTRSSQIVFEKNKNFRHETFPEDEGFSRNPDYKDFDYGKTLPLVNHIIVHIMLEEQPSWLNFLRGTVDLTRLPKDNFDAAIDKDLNLKPDLVAKGIVLTKNPSTTEWFIGFNMDDPVVGGQDEHQKNYAKNRLLRKAIGYAYDSEKDFKLFANGRGMLANQIIPPSIAGFDPKIPPRETNLEKAKALLAQAGYPGGKDLPRLTFDTEASSRTRQMGEFFKNQMAQVGIDVDVRVNTRPELLERKRQGRLQVHMDGWIADYPDAENFMQLLYGPNKPPGPNNSYYNNPEFNKLYEEMAVLAPSPERQKIIDRMNAIFLNDSPWIPNWIANIYYLHQAWMKNYVYSDFGYNNYKYYGLDLEKKKALRSKF